MSFDLEDEMAKARPGFDSPPTRGELLEAVLVALKQDVHEAGVDTPEARVELDSLCDHIKTCVAARKRMRSN